MKTCKKCKRSKSLCSYYVINGNSDGRSGKCKDCTRSDVKKNYRKNIDHYKKYEKSRSMLDHRVKARALYQKTTNGKLAIKKAVKRYREKYPNKYKCHNIVNNAIRDKKLFKKPCEICRSKDNVHAHHDDYMEPLNIRWLCAKHHSSWHRENGEAKNP